MLEIWNLNPQRCFECNQVTSSSFGSSSLLSCLKGRPFKPMGISHGDINRTQVRVWIVDESGPFLPAIFWPTSLAFCCPFQPTTTRSRWEESEWGRSKRKALLTLTAGLRFGVWRPSKGEWQAIERARFGAGPYRTIRCSCRWLHLDFKWYLPKVQAGLSVLESLTFVQVLLELSWPNLATRVLLITSCC